MIEFNSTEVTAWATSIAIFLGSSGLLLIIWQYLQGRLSAWSVKTQSTWDDSIASWLGRPVRLGLILLSLKISIIFAPVMGATAHFLTLLFKISLILIGAWIVERLLVLGMRTRLAFTGVSETIRNFFSNLLRIVIFVLGLLVILDTLGVSITPILASLGVGSLAVGLALQDTLSNFFSGVYLILDKPFELGQLIRVDDATEGFVEKIGWRSTHLRLMNNNYVIVPNSKIANAQVINFDFKDKTATILVQVGVAYGSDLEQVERVSLEVANRVQRSSKVGIDIVPVVRFHTFGDSSINFFVALRVGSWVDQAELRHEFIKALYLEFKQQGIEIPFPQRVIRTVSGSN